LTVLSDIDVVIVSPAVPRNSAEKRRLAIEIREVAVTRYSPPWDYPVDLHLYSLEEFGEAGRVLQ